MKTDYYRVIGVDSRASAAQIKKAYRQKIKAAHPDLNPSDHGASSEVSLLVEAYETLINPVHREEYDRAYLNYTGQRPFDFREFLQAEGDAYSLSRLIFFDLLHDHESEAVEAYTILSKSPTYSLETWFEREDFMDCAYILAEELEQRGKFQEAFELYVRIAALELQKPYFHFFFEEVTQHLRNLVHDSLVKSVSLDELSLLIERVIQLGLNPRETAWFMKTAAENYLKRNQRTKALFYLQESVRLDAKVSGVKELRRRLQVG